MAQRLCLEERVQTKAKEPSARLGLGCAAIGFALLDRVAGVAAQQRAVRLPGPWAAALQSADG